MVHKIFIKPKLKAMTKTLTREHPNVNKQIIDYAMTKVILLNNKLSKDIPSPLEVSIFDLTGPHFVILFLDRQRHVCSKAEE